MEQRFDLENRLLEFATNIVRVADHLVASRAGAHVASQLLRSGTAPLPNHGEAQAAESAADLVHKMSVCLKELRETRRWLLLVQRVPLSREPARVSSLLQESEELIRIFFASIRTAKTKLRGTRG